MSNMMSKPGRFRKVAFLPTLAAMMLAASVTHADVVEQDEEARSPYPKPRNVSRGWGGRVYLSYNTSRECERRLRQRARGIIQ